MELLSEACREVHGNEYLRPVLGAALVMGATPLEPRNMTSLLRRAALGRSCPAHITQLLALAIVQTTGARAQFHFETAHETPSLHLISHTKRRHRETSAPRCRQLPQCRQPEPGGGGVPGRDAGKAAGNALDPQQVRTCNAFMSCLLQLLTWMLAHMRTVLDVQ